MAGEKEWFVAMRRNVILLLLVAQITASALLMRYSRTNDHGTGPKYRPTAAVVATELLKLPICLLMAGVGLGGPRALARGHCLEEERAYRRAYPKTRPDLSG